VSTINPGSVSRKPRLTRKKLGAFLREHGYPISDSVLNKLSAPSVGEGPPIDSWWGKRPLYDPDRGLAWAESRLRRPDMGRVTHVISECAEDP
jgi:hypothetical protein